MKTERDGAGKTFFLRRIIISVEHAGDFDLKRSSYGTWQVVKPVTHERIYESTNKKDAEAILSFLNSQIKAALEERV